MIAVRAGLLIAVAAGAPLSEATAVCLAHRHTARLAAQQLVCHARVAGTSTPVRPACIDRAATRFQARAACVGSAAADLRAAAELYVADVAGALAGPATAGTRDCAAEKLRAMGRATRDALRCHQRGGDTLLACLSQARGGLADRLTEAESTGSCATVNDFSTLSERLDDLVDDVLRVLGPDPAPYRGTYDVTFAFNPSSIGPNYSNAPLGVVDVAPDGRLMLNVHFDRYDALSVSGILANGDFLITGYHVDGGDILREAAGQAAATTDADARRIRGSADIEGYNGVSFGTVTFTLTRPLAGTPSGLGGAYVVAFPESPSGCSCASGTTLDLRVPADGFATSAPAIDARPDTTVEGTFAAGTCLVAPGGSVRCYSPYDPVSVSGPAADCANVLGGACPIIMHGLLPVPLLATGGGEFSSPAPLLVMGTWSATR